MSKILLSMFTTIMLIIALASPASAAYLWGNPDAIQAEPMLISAASDEGPDLNTADDLANLVTVNTDTTAAGVIPDCQHGLVDLVIGTTANNVRGGAIVSGANP